MKEEELIRKLENIELPDIELESHRRRLRMALLDAGYLKRQRGVAILEVAKSRVKGVRNTMIRGLVSRQPVWKTVIAGVLALALIAGLAIALPSLTGQSPEALAAEIAENSPQVQAALGDGEVQVVKVIKIVDGKGTVICEGTMGRLVTAEVDMKTKEVVEVVPMPQLTEEEKEKAVNIAKADPKVQELLDKGASIVRVSPAYFFGVRVNAETGETEEFSETLARVEIELAEKRIWTTVDIDLNGGKVVRLIPAMESYSGPEGKVEYFKVK